MSCELVSRLTRPATGALALGLLLRLAR